MARQILRVPRDRDEYEWMILWAVHYGMGLGYGVDHEKLHEDENRLLKEFAEEYGFSRTSLGTDGS